MKITLGLKEIFIVAGLIIIAIGLPLTVYLSQTRQEIGAEAARGGKGKPAATKATLTVSPSVVYSGGSQYTITGSGFSPNQMVSFSVADPGCCLSFNLWADATGNVSFTRSTGDVGTYTINANQLSGNKYVLMGTISFNVIAP